MKKKIISLLLLLVIPTALLCGCKTIETYPYKTIQSGDRFVIIKELTTHANTVYVEMYDKTTKVMYVYVKLGESGSLTVMLNADGTPLLWDEEL